jgi:hypothetical protein
VPRHPPISSVSPHPHSRSAASLLVALFLLVATAPAVSQEPEIEVEAGANEIYIGESVDYHVEIRNTKDPSPPDMSALGDDFEVTSQGDESRNQSSTFIVNGRITQQNSFSHVYHFRLTPKRTGILTIAAPRATIEGKMVVGRDLRLAVIAPEEQDLVVPEIRIDRTNVYPTQPFEVTLRVLVRPLPDDPRRDPLTPLRRQPPHLEANWVDSPSGLTPAVDKNPWLEPLLSNDGGGFTLNDVTLRSGSFFEGPRPAVFSLYKRRETREGTDGEKIDYFVYELKRSFTSEKAGTYQFGPALVKGAFVDSIENRGYTARRLVAAAPAVTVTIRDVPTPRPATFCGGIGQYRVAASVHPNTLRVGDPLTLTLEVRRGPASGSLELVSAPDLSANGQLAADFEIIDKKPTGRTEGEAKRFAYALRPRRAGVTVGPLAVTIFDPDTETFVEIDTKPIALDVTAATQVAAGDLVGALPNTGAPEIKSREQGIFQNVTDPSELTDQRVDLAALTAVAAGAWCAVGGLIVGVTAYRRKSSEAGWHRRQQARRAAKGRLDEARTALAQGRAGDAANAVRSAVVGLIGDMRNIVAEGLTASEANAALAEANVADEGRSEVVRLLSAIESAQYGSTGAIDAPAMIETAARLVPELARRLEKA